MIFYQFHPCKFYIFFFVLESLQMRLKFLVSIFEPLMRKDLSHEVEPIHYDLFINAEENKFNGNVLMYLTANQPVTSFRFNSKDLELSDLKIKQNNTEIQSSFSEKDEFVTVSLDSEIKGDFTLSVKYSASYSSSMDGFYKSKYNTNNLYSTHFEATDARKAFPCFDQPDMKATFSISIQVPEGNIALSNNSLKEKKGNLYIFNKTPKMSTYIVAYVIGKLDYIEDTTTIPIRVYADASEKHWGKFSLDVAVRCLKFFEKYFGIKYPLPKLDMVAIPSFAMGAMENWGLVTYRKTSLLFDESSTSIRSKKNIANTVCHELAHMWFGNLVTMQWWSDLWLNEGFATWAATLAIANSIQDILPSDAWTNFINDDMNSGMAMDSIKSTHRIGIEVEDPAEIDQIFDAISYDKGSSVIRMLENWLGNETFKNGLMHYLDKYKYQNAVTQNLWDSLSYVANKSNTKEKIDVAAVIDPWIHRDGFPYIKVTDLGSELLLTQERFTVGYEKEDAPWPIPINILWIKEEQKNSGGSESTTHLITDRTMKIKKNSSIYKINDNVSGFYRVLYPSGYVKNLLQYNLSPANRLNLFSDAFSSAIATLTPLQDSLDLLEILGHEDNYDVLLAVLSQLEFFKTVFYDRKDKVEYFNQKIIEIVKQRFGSIDLSSFSKDINTASANSLIVSYAVSSYYQDAIKLLNSVKVKDINPEYMRAFFTARIDGEFKQIYELYKSSNKPGEKQHALVALGKTSIEENIDFIFSHLDVFEPHDSIYLFASLGSNLLFRSKIVDLFISKFGEIKKHIANSSILRNCILYVLNSYVEEESDNAKVKKFLESLDSDPELESALKKIRDHMDVAMILRKRYLMANFE